MIDILLQKLQGAQPYREGVKSLCPFHDENTPSFFVYQKPEGWFFKCHGCQKGGSVSYLLHVLRVDPKISKAFASRTQSRHRQDQEILTPHLIDTTIGLIDDYAYYRSRGIDDGISRRFRFKFDVRGPAAVIPIYHKRIYRGAVRRMIDPGMTRYFLDPGLQVDNVLWGFDQCVKENITVVTEGIIDAACWWSFGVQAVALLGNKWTKKLDDLRTLKRVIVIPDNGDRFSIQTFHKLSVSLCCPVTFIPAGFKDTSEFVTAHRPDAKQEIQANLLALLRLDPGERSGLTNCIPHTDNPV